MLGMAHLHVLIVDDEPDILMLLRLALQTAGHEITEASDGRAAIARLHEHHFDLVLLDAMMPVMDGWAALERMRELDEQPPVIMVSAKTAETDRNRAFSLGAADYVTKPFEPAHLLETMDTVLGRPGTGSLAVAAGAEPQASGY